MSNITPQMQAQLAATDRKATTLLLVQQRNKEAARLQLELIKSMISQKPVK